MERANEVLLKTAENLEVTMRNIVNEELNVENVMAAVKCADAITKVITVHHKARQVDHEIAKDQRAGLVDYTGQAQPTIDYVPNEDECDLVPGMNVRIASLAGVEESVPEEYLGQYGTVLEILKTEDEEPNVRVSLDDYDDAVTVFADNVLILQE